MPQTPTWLVELDRLRQTPGSGPSALPPWLVEADALASAFEDQTRPQWMREADALAAELEDQLRLHTEAEAESPLVRVQDVPITVSRALLSVPEAAVGLA